MEIFREDKKSKLSCGINDDGVLFFGNDESGFNLPDTPENRELVVQRFNEEMRDLYLSDWKSEFSFDLKEILDYVKDTEEDVEFLHAFQCNPKLMEHYLSECRHRMDKAEDAGGQLSWEEAVYCFDDAITSTKAEFKENLQEYSLDDTRYKDVGDIFYIVQSSYIIGDGEEAGNPKRFYAGSLEEAEEVYRIECEKGCLVDLLHGTPGHHDTVKQNYDFRDGHFFLNPSEVNKSEHSGLHTAENNDLDFNQRYLVTYGPRDLATADSLEEIDKFFSEQRTSDGCFYKIHDHQTHLVIEGIYYFSSQNDFANRWRPDDFTHYFEKENGCVIREQRDITSLADDEKGIMKFLVLGNWKKNDAMPDGEYATWIATNDTPDKTFVLREGNTFPTVFYPSAEAALKAAKVDFRERFEKEFARIIKEDKELFKQEKERGFSQ